MSILIADCGATTCNYFIIHKDGKITKYHTEGFSPVANEWHTFPLLNINGQVAKVVFYGTAMTGYFLGQAQKALKEQFPDAEVQVLSDLHAAGYSTAGDETAYIHILGTGSSTCAIEDGKITFPVINMGYLWEDYASGYDIAKTIVSYWANNQLLEADSLKLKAKLGEVKQFIKRTYNSTSPKLFLAEHSYWINELSPETQIKIKNECLDHFFKKNIDNFADSKPHHFIGSMAILMEKEIRIKLQERSLKAGLFVKDTSDGLLKYHLNKTTNHNE